MIYLTKMLSNNETVVLKTIDKEKISCSELAVMFAKRESVVHAQMNHPNIIKAFHYGETEKNFMIYMEYAGYGSNYLTRRLAKNKPVAEERLSIWA